MGNGPFLNGTRITEEGPGALYHYRAIADSGYPQIICIHRWVNLEAVYSMGFST